jgi:hypothetical protein
MKVLKACLRDALVLSPAAKATFEALKNVRASALDVNLRFSFLCHMLWFCAHDAAARGFWDVAYAQLNLLANKLAPQSALSLTESEIKYQMIFFSVASSDRRTFLKLIEKSSEEIQVIYQLSQ